MSNGSILSPTATLGLQGRQKISRSWDLLHVKSYVGSKQHVKQQMPRRINTPIAEKDHPFMQLLANHKPIKKRLNPIAYCNIWAGGEIEDQPCMGRFTLNHTYRVKRPPAGVGRKFGEGGASSGVLLVI
ncbi:hypothetical protein AVEN_19271-1 [Araneus ventricosus]|uniref:Uncharacterized protein n=1 Tax=Araneus ventricosus TaxID=182803 RepID=A0A4Y2HK59_ARAVE|nr:hypothetical protein AVEN_19271-1 [Araneus ventricosus]